MARDVGGRAALRFLGACFMAMALFVSTPSFGIDLDFGNVPEESARLVFNGNTDSFTFNTAAAGPFIGFEFRINGSDSVIADSVGLLGRIEGTFTIGAVMPFGGGEIAEVTSSPGARIRIQDRNGLWWEGEVDWVELISIGTGGFLNINGTINVTAVTYNGVNSDLLALKNAGGNTASAILAFTFNPAQSITQLKADGNIQRTSYEGDIVAEACTGQIGNFVWQDLNGNGCQDGNEPGLAGVKVELFSGDCAGAGVKIGEQITTGTGAYLFSGLCPGNYQVKFTPPAGYVATLPLQNCALNGGDPTRNQTDSKCNCVGGGLCTVCVTLTEANPLNLNIDCGYVLTLSLNCAPTASGQVGVPYSSALVVSGGCAPYTFAIISGSLPPGLMLNPNTGVITGTPTTAGVFPYVAQVTDCGGRTADTSGQNCSITITTCDCVLTCAPDKTVECGQRWSFNPPTASDACSGANVTISIVSTVTNAGPCQTTATRTWEATDSCNQSARCSQTVTVRDTTPPVITFVPIGGELGCNPATLPTDASVMAQVTATDNCGVPTINVTHVDGGTACASNRTFTITATDRCNNTSAPRTVVYTFGCAPCVPGTFTFSGSSADTGSPNIRTFTANGVTVKVSAFSRRKDTGAWSLAYVGLYSGGLGVTDTSEDGSDPSHTVDNVGRDNFLLFEFSQSVVVDRAYLGFVEDDSDLNAWIGTFADPFNNHLTLSDMVLGQFGPAEENVGGSSTRWADLNAGQVSGNALVISARRNDTRDQFKLNKLDLCKPDCAPAMPPPCVSGTVTFSGSSADTGSPNIRTFTANGVTVKVSAFSRRKDTGAWSLAYVGLYSGGLGVTDTSEDGSDPSHTVDNVGRDNFLLFEFSQSVVVDRAYLGFVEDDSDLNAWIGTFADPFNNHLTLSDMVLGQFGPAEENLGGSSTRWADLNAGQVSGNALVIAARRNDSKDQFKVNKLGICIPGAVEGLPSPWRTKDVGSVRAAGGAGYSNGKFTVIGSGADIWSDEDEFRFVYQSASGDCSVVARVTDIQNTNPWAKAGVMIRNSLSDDSKHAAVFLTPGNGVAFLTRSSSGGSTVNSNNPKSPVAPYWVRIVRTGNTFTGSYSVDGSSWTSLGSKTISMGSSVYIGLAVTSHADGTLCTATFDNVTASP